MTQFRPTRKPTKRFLVRAWFYRLCHRFVSWFAVFMYPAYSITPGYIVEKTLRGRIAKHVFHSCPTTRLYKSGEYERLYGKV
jgi:hypothetical protein